MRRPLATQSDLMNVGARLVEALNANSGELGYFEGHRTKLVSILDEIRELMTEQDALNASKLSVTKKIDTLHEAGVKLVKLLRRMVQEHYGTRNDKVAEFGVQPFRGRPRGLPGTGTPPDFTPPPPAIE